jgi:FMN phosphatase YigB (HAD superfamily)
VVEGALPFDLPFTLVTASELQAYLPSADLLRAAASRLGCALRHTLVASARERDLAGARALGMQTIQLPDLAALVGLAQRLCGGSAGRAPE